jgi:hypothetical protein
MRAMVVVLSLSLLVLGVIADHSHNTFAANDLALVADLLDAGSDFHCFLGYVDDTDSGLAERQTRDDASTWIETGPLDQYTLPRPYMHAHPSGIEREAGRKDRPRGMRGLEAIQVLGQLSDHDCLEGIGVKLVHGGLKSAEGWQKSPAVSSRGRFRRPRLRVSLDQCF